jgi:hypothetical protein
MNVTVPRCGLRGISGFVGKTGPASIQARMTASFDTGRARPKNGAPAGWMVLVTRRNVTDLSFLQCLEADI